MQDIPEFEKSATTLNNHNNPLPPANCADGGVANAAARMPQAGVRP